MNAANMAETQEFDAAELGAMMREMRENLGRSLAEVADDLRIRLVYLEAIEAGRLADLPGSAYVAGFLRAYSDYLGLDGDEIVRRFRMAGVDMSNQTQLHLPSPVEEGRLPTGPILLVAAIVAGLAYGGWYYLSSSRDASVDQVAELPNELSKLIGKEAKDGGPGATPPVALDAPVTPDSVLQSNGPAPASAETAPASGEGAPAASTPSDTATPAPAEAASAAPPAEPAEKPAEKTAETPSPSSSPSQSPEAPTAPAPESAATESAAPPAAPAAQPEKEVPPEPAATAADRPAQSTAAAPAQQAALPSDSAASGTSGSDTSASDNAVSDNTASDNQAAENTPADDSTPDETPPPDTASPTAAPEAVSAPEPAAAVASVPPAETTPAAPASSSAATGGKAPRIVIRAKADSFVAILTSDKQTLFSQLMRAGDSYEVPSGANLVLDTGNAGALEITVGGRKAPALGQPGEVRRNIPLEADALLKGGN